ncbi:fibronectin type III domain-containing protein [Chryseolinea soli]|nr:fibronectin type III domain-containing protein [Chryseolinea soli]
MNKIVKVALRLSEMNDEALEVKAQSIIQEMTDNANFPAPIPELDAMKTALTAFQAALVKQKSGSKADTAAKNAARVVLQNAYRALASVVEVKSNNDLSILLTSGFEARKNATPAGRLEKPADLKVTLTDKPGSVKVSVSKIERAVSYMFQYALSPVTDETQWKTLTGTSRSKTIDGLEPGRSYMFRVAGVGSDPAIVYSDTVTRIVA